MGGAEVGRGADELGVEEEGWGMAAVAARVRASVFCAALRASGRAFRPDLTPPLYRSVNLTCGCLQLMLPIRATAWASGGSGSARRGHFRRRVAPIRLAVSLHVP